MKKGIYLAEGCFWGIERYVNQIKRFAFSKVGYANSITAHPTYQEVCTDRTQVAETKHIRFNTCILTFPLLLSTIFKANVPTGYYHISSSLMEHAHQIYNHPFNNGK